MPTFNMAAAQPNGQPAGAEAVYSNGIPHSYPGREYTNQSIFFLHCDVINFSFRCIAIVDTSTRTGKWRCCFTACCLSWHSTLSRSWWVICNSIPSPSLSFTHSMLCILCVFCSHFCVQCFPFSLSINICFIYFLIQYLLSIEGQFYQNLIKRPAAHFIVLSIRYLYLKMQQSWILQKNKFMTYWTK